MDLGCFISARALGFENMQQRFELGADLETLCFKNPDR
jgi:hypothetical protein